MKKWQRRLLWAFGCTAVLSAALWFSFPAYVRWQIHKRHPEVGFGDLDVSLHRVTLHNVRLDKGWLKATADTATIDPSTEAVHLTHGHIDVDYDMRPSHAAGSKVEQPNVTAEDFTVSITSAKHQATATLDGVNVDGTRITATSALVHYKDYVVSLTPVEVGRDFSYVKISAVTFPEGLSLPKPLPEIAHPGANGIEVDVNNRAATVANAGFELAEDQGISARVEGVHLSVEGDKVAVSLDHFFIVHPWLVAASDGPVDFERVGFTVGRDWKAPLDLHLKNATIHVDPGNKSISGDEACATWVEALPRELAAGPLGGRTTWDPAPHLQFSLGLLPQPHFSLSGSCKATCDDPAVVSLRHRFKYTTYNAKGALSPEPRETGPETPSWTRLGQINEVMPLAVMNMEDLAFPGHHGYIPSALENSFLADVKSGKFERGGSTITMQLAKNVWLTRTKTFTRKVSELFLSQILESCFSKNEIMELYLNVVEFGPNIYGVRQAAGYYFNEGPMQLGPQEAFYLAWILPRPRNSPPPNAATMDRMGALMHTLVDGGRIPDTMLLSVDSPDTKGWEQAP